jgi:Dyp-type peroxidase family
MRVLENPTLLTDDIQADIVPGLRRGSDLDYAQHFLLLRVADRDRARAGLRELLPSVTAARAAVPHAEVKRPDTSTNLGFTFAGLQALAPERDELDEAFAAHEAFRLGLAKRSEEKVVVEGEAERFDLLGDPTRWVVGNDANQVHVVVNLGAMNATLLEGHVDDVRQQVSAGFDIAYEQPAALRCRTQEEPFGFADGLAQPRIEGFHTPPPQGVVAQPLQPPERFLVAEGRQITTDGSFMVWVRFRQYPDRFEKHCEAVAAHLESSGYPGITPCEAAALEVGRVSHGDPLRRRPVTANRPLIGPTDTFDYTQDFYGRDCPRHAHVRKMNPRNAKAEEVAILRRGIPFDQRAEAGDREEGLVFVCYQASIERQFERLQGYWANAAYEPEANASPDLLISQAARSPDGCTVEVPWPDGGSIPVTVHNDWIEPTGGVYAFVPSLPALHLLFD